MSLAILNPQEELNHNQVVLNNEQQRRSIIKKKVLAIGKMSKNLSVLRDHPHLVKDIKQRNSGKLPYGTLAQGEQGLLKALNKFKSDTTFKHMTVENLEQKDRSLQHMILATPNTKVAREGQV
ncbi:hypothetical protein BJ944DRAFT_244971 [Cunninghamella echinulata]|nr:hypothetical protein BJ944DRAFT_244971 [Cunninghamella echinulata]